VGVYLHPKRPKASLKHIINLVHSAGAKYSDKDPDIAIVVGGDGTFGYYGRLLSIPMLFVGIRNSDILGSKARLAYIFFEELPKALKSIQRSKFFINERKMLSKRHLD
jgi:NAD+ kinase